MAFDFSTRWPIYAGLAKKVMQACKAGDTSIVYDGAADGLQADDIGALTAMWRLAGAALTWTEDGKVTLDWGSQQGSGSGSPPADGSDTDPATQPPPADTPSDSSTDGDQASGSAKIQASAELEGQGGKLLDPTAAVKPGENGGQTPAGSATSSVDQSQGASASKTDPQGDKLQNPTPGKTPGTDSGAASTPAPKTDPQGGGQENPTTPTQPKVPELPKDAGSSSSTPPAASGGSSPAANTTSPDAGQGSTAKLGDLAKTTVGGLKGKL